MIINEQYEHRYETDTHNKKIILTFTHSFNIIMC